jgi:hypothetical protein
VPKVLMPPSTDFLVLGALKSFRLGHKKALKTPVFCPFLYKGDVTTSVLILIKCPPKPHFSGI